MQIHVSNQVSWEKYYMLMVHSHCVSVLDFELISFETHFTMEVMELDGLHTVLIKIVSGYSRNRASLELSQI